MKRNIVLSAIVLSIASTLPVIGYAEDDIATMKNKLIVSGYDFDLVDSMAYEDLIENYNMSQDESFSITSSVVEVDIIEEIEDFLQADEDTLMVEGFTEEDILDMEENIEELSKMSLEEMEKEFGATPAEYYVLQEVIEDNQEQTTEESDSEFLEEDTVTSSGSISTSTMTYSMSSTDKSSKTAPSYNIKINFNWKKAFIMRGLSDKVAAAWSGSFNTKSVSSNLTYGTVSTGNNWSTAKNANKTNQKASVSHTPNKGITFSMTQNKKIDNAKTHSVLKSGSVSFTLFQNSKKNQSSKVVSRYSHSKLGASGFGISSGGTANINVGKKNDVSGQASKNITN